MKYKKTKLDTSVKIFNYFILNRWKIASNAVPVVKVLGWSMRCPLVYFYEIKANVCFHSNLKLLTQSFTWLYCGVILPFSCVESLWQGQLMVLLSTQTNCGYLLAMMAMLDWMICGQFLYKEVIISLGNGSRSGSYLSIF